MFDMQLFSIYEHEADWSIEQLGMCSCAVEDCFSKVKEISFIFKAHWAICCAIFEVL
jgi:hypothetical protein